VRFVCALHIPPRKMVRRTIRNVLLVYLSVFIFWVFVINITNIRKKFVGSKL